MSNNPASAIAVGLNDPAFSPPEDSLFPEPENFREVKRQALAELATPLFEDFFSETQNTDVPARTITIRRPRVENRNGRARLSAQIDIECDSREIWFEVDEKYGKYLCHERSDAFLIGLLNWAMRERCDFVCEAPVGEELIYQIRTYLIPALAKASQTLYAPKITAEIDTEMLPCAGAVGTGISCGVDSLHVVANHARSAFPHLRLTHLILNNVGAFSRSEGKNQFSWQTEHAEQFAREYGFEFIRTNSNFAEAFPQNHLLTHTYSSCFSIYVLQKLWRVYFYASSGHDFTQFRLERNEEDDSAHYELLSLDVFSTRNLKIYSEGGAKTRFEKTRALVDFVPAQKYLHVCTNDTGANCNVCGKCKRTLVTLDALGALEKFRAVFDIGYYKKHRRSYLRWLAAQQFLPHGDLMLKEPFRILRKDISLRTRIEALPHVAIVIARSRLGKIPLLKAIYRKYFKRKK